MGTSDVHQRFLEDDRDLGATVALGGHDLERGAIRLAVVDVLEHHVAGVRVLVEQLGVELDAHEAHRGREHLGRRVPDRGLAARGGRGRMRRERGDGEQQGGEASHDAGASLATGSGASFREARRSWIDTCGDASEARPAPTYQMTWRPWMKIA